MNHIRYPHPPDPEKSSPGHSQLKEWPIQSNPEGLIPVSEAPLPAQLALGVLETIRRVSKGEKVSIGGMLRIKAGDHPEIPIALLTQPGGGYICWYIEGENHHAYALVNENCRHICTIPLDRQEEFQSKLREIQQEMGE